MTSEWLGHRDLCPIQWSDWCDCGDEPVELVDDPSPSVCLCSPVSGVDIECPEHGMGSEPPYMETLDESERRGD